MTPVLLDWVSSGSRASSGSLIWVHSVVWIHKSFLKPISLGSILFWAWLSDLPVNFDSYPQFFQIHCCLHKLANFLLLVLAICLAHKFSFNTYPHIFLSYCGCGYCLVAESSLTLSTPWTDALQAPLSVGFPRQAQQSRLPFSQRVRHDGATKPFTFIFLPLWPYSSVITTSSSFLFASSSGPLLRSSQTSLLIDLYISSKAPVANVMTEANCSHTPRLSPRLAVPLSVSAPSETLLSHQDVSISGPKLSFLYFSIGSILSTNIHSIIITLIHLYWSLRSTFGAFQKPTNLHLQHCSPVSSFSSLYHFFFVFIWH